MTHTTKHTPGPWVVEKGWNGDRPTITAKVSKTQVIDNRGLIADLEHTPFIEHAQANARLIAAAPAMYEALAKLRLEAIHYRNTGVGKQFLNEAIAQAEQAINQVWGEGNHDTKREG